MRFCISTILICLFLHPTSAQVGVMGKRVLLNTDIINGIKRPVSTANIEVALSRSFSLELGYSFGEIPLHAKFHHQYFADWVQSASDETWNHYLPTYSRDIHLKYNINSKISSAYVINTITSKQKIIGGNLKFYSKGIFSAPQGPYNLLGFRAGIQSISGQFDVPYFYYNTSNNNYKINGARTIQFADIDLTFASLILGRGKQFLINPRVMLDINCGISCNFVSTRDFDNNSIFLSVVGQDIGSNVLTFIKKATPSSDISPFDLSTDKIYSNTGLFLNVKLGLLLF